MVASTDGTDYQPDMRTGRFTTSTFRLEDRFDAWRTRHWPSLAPTMDCTPPEGAFAADVETLTPAGMAVLYSDMTGFHFARGPQRVRGDGLDQYGLLLSDDIAFVGNAAGRDFAGGAGQLLVGDFARPIEQASTSGRAVSLVLPRRAAEAVVPEIAAMHGRVVGAERTGLLRDFLAALRVRGPDLKPGDEARIARILLELIGLALSTDEEAEPRCDTGEARFWAVDRFIRSQLSRRDLDGDLLMRKFRLGRSTLYRMFADRGGVAEHIRNLRLDRAAALLAAPGAPARVGAVARAVGYADQAAFSRAFRRRHGCAPRDYRNRAEGDA
jgi:AraC-like DNA-binding protein